MEIIEKGTLIPIYAERNKTVHISSLRCTVAVQDNVCFDGLTPVMPQLIFCLILEEISQH